MTTRSRQAEDDEDLGGVVVPLHRGHAEPGRRVPPGEWSRFDPDASRDALTHLHGHPWFEEDLRGAARRRRGGENPWVAVAAVDGLAAIDRQLGPEAAGEALQAVAVRLRDSLRSGDKLARIGEERFGLIVDAPYADEAIATFERIEQAVRELAAASPRWPGLSLRVGLAPLWAEDPPAALEQAGEALARSREPGGRTVMMTTAGRPG
jgi:diguanylate cyclase (GGDEF)-like protein